MTLGKSAARRLTGIPETMLMTLYHRATEARRPDAVLKDPEAVRICDALDFDFAGRFGPAVAGSAARSALFDEILRSWIALHPRGLVVSLGEGLETQPYRVDNGTVRWLSIDLPDSLEVRERFLPPTKRFRHLAKSALDFSWMDALGEEPALFFNVQGLLMYFAPADVKALFTTVAVRFSHAEMLFDFVPEWMSRRTVAGLKLSPQYRLPPMPWGINGHRVEPALRRWVPHLGKITVGTFDMVTHGVGKMLYRLARRTPGLSDRLMGYAHVRFRD